MQQSQDVTQGSLKTPKAAAIAGIVFSLLLVIIFWLFRNAMPADPLEPGLWLTANRRSVTLALHLVLRGHSVFVVHRRLTQPAGQQEDRFFATVFLGSALLFLAMIFVSATIIGALLLTSSSPQSRDLIGMGTFNFARATPHLSERICHQVGRCIFGDDIDGGDLHGDRTPLDRRHGLRSSRCPLARQLLLQLGFHCLARMGAAYERLHHDRQFPSSSLSRASIRYWRLLPLEAR